MLTADGPVRRNEVVVGSEPNLPAFGVLPPLIKAFHDLAYEVDKNVLIPDSRESVCTWRDREAVTVVFVMADSEIGLLGQTEHGVLHAMPVILECPIENVCDKEIASRMAIRQK